MDFKQINADFIRTYCIENNQKAWYNATVSTKVTDLVYPDGEDGKPDKSQKPTKRERNITFIELKLAFCKKFMPEIVPHKQKKPSMFDLL